ncbi:MAG: hypothetical protein OXL37_15040 [Chloroflexota bacterium]|nr:hypothetical protein [Chloroflexota bacterium]MDE2961716.1 hypothetical protein [Chloroflexota bacterium]
MTTRSTIGLFSRRRSNTANEDGQPQVSKYRWADSLDRGRPGGRDIDTVLRRRGSRSNYRDSHKGYEWQGGDSRTKTCDHSSGCYCGTHVRSDADQRACCTRDRSSNFHADSGTDGYTHTHRDSITYRRPCAHRDTGSSCHTNSHADGYASTHANSDTDERGMDRASRLYAT